MIKGTKSYSMGILDTFRDASAIASAGSSRIKAPETVSADDWLAFSCVHWSRKNVTLDLKTF